jgi:glutathione S-transferase
MPSILKMYALPHSYYSGKARSYLRYKRIPYQEVVSTVFLFKTFIKPRTGVQYIPVIQTPDDMVVQDTSDIIDFLEARYPAPSVYPETPRQKLVSLLFELYADEWMIIPAMHYRWSFWDQREHINDVLEHFGMLLSPLAPRWLRRKAGKQFCQPFNGALPLLGVTPRSIPAVEADYETFLDRMNAHFAKHDYLLGGRASIGDFGLIGPLYAHLGRDFYPKALMQKRAPHVYAWVERMNSTTPVHGEFLPDDQIPDTLLPLLQNIFAQHFPLLQDTVRLLDAWLEENPGRKIRRIIGNHNFRIGEVEEQRAVFPYAQWMLQRPLDYYQGLPATQKAPVDALLHSVGGYEAMQLKPRRRVRRVDNRIVADPPAARAAAA